MKRLIIFCLFCTLGLTVFAQKPYAVYECSGQVRIKEYKGQTWQPALKNQPLSGLDSVDVVKGSLRIIDTRSNLIYQSAIIGKTRVLTIINDAQKQNSRTLAAVNRELLNGAKSATSAPSMQVAGATQRGDEEDGLVDSIAATFAWLAQQVLKGQQNKSSMGLQLEAHNTSEGVYFSLHNHTDKGYYVNVLHVNKQSQTANLCYIIEEVETEGAPFLYLPQGESMHLPALVFNRNVLQDVFLFIGTEDSYIPAQLQSVLRYIDIRSAQPLYTKYLFDDEQE